MLKYYMKSLAEAVQDINVLWDVLDGLKLPALSVDADLRITDINASVTGRLFFEREDVVNSPVTDIIRTASPLNRDSFTHNTSVLHGRCLRKDRESFPARITFIKNPEGYVAVIEDQSDLIKITTRASQRSREINTYNALSKTLSRATELKDMVQGVLNTLVDVMNIDAAWLYLIDEKSQELRLSSFKGLEKRMFEGAEALKPYECFIGRVLSSERSLLVRNAMEDPRITHLKVREYGVKSVAGVPLIIKSIGDSGNGKVVGVLGVASRMADLFTSLDMQFITTVGNQLGVAIENVRLIENLKEKMKQIELINEISSVVNSSLTIGHIFRLIVSEVKKMIGFDRASINLLDENRNLLRIFALDTKRSTKLKKGVYAPLKGTSAGWVTLNQKPWINMDLQEDIPFELDSRLYDEGIRSTISIPLYKDRPLGALNFDSIHPGSYSEKDLEILLPIAKHLSIALENALLFEEISREKREWEKTFDAITDMVWVEDTHGKVLRVNKAVIENSGRPELSLIKRSSGEIFNALKIVLQSGISHEPVETRRKLYRELRGAGGSTYHYWAYPLIDNEGRIYGVINYLRDISEQKSLEQQLLRSEKLASLGTLVAGIAHEINNPLGIIAAYAEALLDRAKEPSLAKMTQFEDFPEYLETIHKEIFRCKDILKGLLDFARPSTGTFREIEINELIKEVILLVKHKAQRKNHTIELRLNDEIPKTMADPGALRQMFINIIMNSLYFMESAGKIVISTDYGSEKLEEEIILISISDNGKGIDSRIAERIFDPFFTTKPVGDGTGLGLSICHRIVTDHGGTIDLESKKETGTTFNIRIPVKRRR